MIKLSIIVLTYNHEKYIKEAIESILAQKVDFDYEVLIGEDCSTDNTRKILQELEPKLPANFCIFYREQNMGIIDNSFDLASRMKGEYYSVLEGDDYWIDDGKLQKQVDFLDAHKDYIGCAHNVIVVDENSRIKKENYPECRDSEYTLRHFERGILPGQTCSCLYRNILIDERYSESYSLFWERQMAGDRKIAFVMISQGKIRVFQEKWGAYRHITLNGSSFSANLKTMDRTSETASIIYYSEMIRFSNAIHNSEAAIAAKTLYYKELIKNMMIRRFLKDFLKEKNRLYIAYKILYTIIYKKISLFMEI